MKKKNLIQIKNIHTDTFKRKEIRTVLKTNIVKKIPCLSLRDDS